MVIPTIHLNGTGRHTLLNEYQAAIDAIRLAEKVVGAVTVHGRDYYPQDIPQDLPGASFQVAAAQFRNLMDRLGDVRRTLEGVYAGIADQC